VAGLSGFASITSYNRNFLKYVGVSPTQWRRNAASRA
jgi:AraC-like DNA-binding protein